MAYIKKSEPLTLDFSQQPAACRFLTAVADGVIPGYTDQVEICVFGARGDGKTIAALSAMVAHAQKHFQAGYPLPVRWIGVRDTFTNHRLTTCVTLEKPLWQSL